MRLQTERVVLFDVDDTDLIDDLRTATVSHHVEKAFFNIGDVRITEGSGIF
jgi:hypothetical protein